MTTETNETTPVEPPKGTTAEEWLNSLDDTQKGFLEAHTKGLKSALDSERDARKEQEKNLKDLKSKAEKGSEMEAELAKKLAEVEQANKRADFYEAATVAGVKNPRLAWITATADDLFKRDGRPDLDALKEKYPELFNQPSPNGKAGSGAGAPPPKSNTVDDILRRKAGR